MLASIAAIVLYPRANWLFVLALAWIALFAFAIFTDKGPPPLEVADIAERLLVGRSHGRDVDDYENMNPRLPEVRDLWQETMRVGGRPEEWAGLDSERKNKMREIIEELRQVASRS